MGDRLRRIALGLAYAAKPARVAGVPALLALSARQLLTGDRRLPTSADALDAPDGLCGLARDLDPETLVEGYARGMYPFGHVGPLKWWATRQRMVLFFPEAHLAKRLRRQIRNDGYRVTFDQAFPDVMRACARPRTGRAPLTWITPRMMRAFQAAHEAGHAHSFEVWNAAGELVGGGYGIAFGRLFSTESQFSHEPNTSKIGFAALNYHLDRWGFVCNDGKDWSATIDGMGFRLIDRDAYDALCDEHGRKLTYVGRWSVEADLDEISKWQPGAAMPAAA